MHEITINNVVYIPKPLAQSKPKIVIPVDNCYKCGSDQIRVIESRSLPNGVRARRRKCLACGARWNTKEVGCMSKKMQKFYDNKIKGEQK